jgi:hypothetical protein
MDKLNFGGMGPTTSIAPGRLRKSCSNVTENLNQLDKRTAR